MNREPTSTDGYRQRNEKFCITEKSGSKRYFDASGRLAGLSITRPQPAVISIYYASQDHISVISDGVGRKYRFSYDSSGNLTKISLQVPAQQSCPLRPTRSAAII